MYHLTVSPTIQEQVSHYAQHHPHAIVRRRMFTVHLVTHGHSRKAVAHLLHITPKTVRAHLTLYRQKGIEGLLTLKYVPRCGALDLHRDRIVEVLEQEPPATVKEARARIQAHLQLTRCPTQVRLFLKKISVSAGRSANCRPKRTTMPK